MTPAALTWPAPALAMQRQRLSTPGLAGVLGTLLAACCVAKGWGGALVFAPWLASAVVLSALLPLIAELCTKRREHPVPFLPVVGVLYAIYYGLPVLLADETIGLRPEADSLVPSLLVALAGWWCLMLGFSGTRHGARARGAALSVGWDASRARTLAVWLLAAGIAAGCVSELVDVPPATAQLVGFLAGLAQVGIGLLAVLGWRGEIPRWARRLTWWLVVPVFLLLQLAGGSVAALVFPILFLAMLAWAFGRRVPLGALAAAVLMTLLLRGSASEFRALTWEHGPAADLPAAQKSLLFLDVAAHGMLEAPEERLEMSLDLMRERTGHFALLQRVVARTPDFVPYWGGMTYATLPGSLVPRVLWPDKPAKEVGQDFGHRYGVLASDDSTTSVNLPQLVEFYANFGPAGVLIGMTLLGMLYGALTARLNTRAAGIGSLVIAAIVFSRLANIESDFSLVFGTLLQQIAALWLILRLIRPAAPAERAT